MSQAAPAVAVVASGSTKNAPLSPVMEGTREKESRGSIKRLSNGLEAIDVLLRSALDAKRALELVVTGNFQARNLRHAEKRLVQPIVAAMAGFCACNDVLTADPQAKGKARYETRFQELDPVTFDELGHSVTLAPWQALDGLMESLTSVTPPMACYYERAEKSHVVHPAWEDAAAFSDDGQGGALMDEDAVEAMVDLWAQAAERASSSSEDAQSLMFQMVQDQLDDMEAHDDADNESPMRWAARLKDHIIDKVISKASQTVTDVALDMRLVWLHNNCVRILQCLQDEASPVLLDGQTPQPRDSLDLDSDTPISTSADASTFAESIAEALVPLSEEQRSAHNEPESNSNEYDPYAKYASSTTSLGGHDGDLHDDLLNNVDAHHYVALDELAYQLSTASFVDIKEFKQEFDDLDVDGRGELDLEQFGELMHRINIDIAAKFVPYIFNKFDKNRNGLISYSEIIADYSVPRKAFIKFVNDKYEDVLHVRTLPLAIVYFFLFIYVSDFRELSGDLYHVTGAVMQRCLVQTEVYYEPEGRLIDFASIQSPDEFWYWFEYGFFSAFGADPNTALSIVNSSNYDVDENSFNIIVNNQISLRQDRKAATDCDAQYSMAINATCFDRTTYGTATFGRRLCEAGEVPEQNFCFQSESRPDLDRAFVSNPPDLEYGSLPVSEDVDSIIHANFGTNFSMASTQRELRSKTSYLQGRHWIDSMTANVYIGVPIYNIATGAWANMIYTLEVSDTGLYSTRHYYEVAVTGPYTEDKWYRWIPDVAWGCVLITLVVVEVKSIVRHASNPAKLGLCRKPRDAEGRVIGRAYFHHGWNYFDWILITLVYLQSIYWFARLASQGPVIVEYVQSSKSADDVVNIVGHLGRSMWDYRIITVVTIILWIIRFFKSFMAQPRLAMITKAFRRSAEDLVHFAIVFVLLLVGFMYMGTNLFGHELDSFSDSFHAYWTLFYALVGEFEYEDALTVAPLWGTIFWFLYIFLMTLVVLNMLLAIIIEAYLAASKESVEKHGQGKPPKLITMWDQIWSSLVNMYHTCRGSINLDQLVELLELIEAEEGVVAVDFDGSITPDSDGKSTVIELTQVTESDEDDPSDLHPAQRKGQQDRKESTNSSVSKDTAPTAADLRRSNAMKNAGPPVTRSARSPRASNFRSPRRVTSIGSRRDSDMLALSDVTLSLPRLMTFPEGEAGITAKKISMNFIFDIFREFVLTRQEPRNAQIDQMCRRISDLDSDFQGMMESMDSLESMLQSIQRQQYMLMNHLNVDDSSRSLKVEGARLTHAAIRRAVSTGAVDAPFTARSPHVNRIVQQWLSNSPKFASGSNSGWRNVARHMPLVPDRRNDPTVSHDRAELHEGRHARNSLSTMGTVSMAMARLGRRRTEAAAPGAPAAGEDLDRVRQKLGASKRLESFNDIMEASVAGLVGEETKLAHRGGKRKSSGSSRRSTVASSASHQNASQISRTRSYDVTKRQAENFKKNVSRPARSEKLGINLTDLEGTAQ